jgi:hypothetical protein
MKLNLSEAEANVLEGILHGVNWDLSLSDDPAPERLALVRSMLDKVNFECVR